MSTDRSVTKHLMETLENGRLGYEKAAEKLSNEAPELLRMLQDAASQRAGMYQELDVIASRYGDDLDEKSTVAGAVHRGWMAVKDAFTGDSAEAILNAAATGEDYAIEQYEEAISNAISPEFRPVLERQLQHVRSARAALDSFRKTA